MNHGLKVDEVINYTIYKLDIMKECNVFVRIYMIHV